MAELFETTPQNVVTHLGNVFSDKELEEPATSKDFLIVQIEGRRRVRRPIKHYNLDAIISVGYRVNSRRGMRFRQWATTTLREHLVRGYTLNRQRFEDNARELESALVLVRKAASGEALTTDQGRGLVDIIARYTQPSSSCSATTRGCRRFVHGRCDPAGARPRRRRTLCSSCITR